MGRKSKLVKYSSKQEPYAVNLANQALQIRKQHFYNSCGIRLLTCDSILDIAKTQTLSHKKIAGDPTASINLKILSPQDSIFVVESSEVKLQ